MWDIFLPSKPNPVKKELERKPDAYKSSQSSSLNIFTNNITKELKERK
jgi:hypothetical protein